MFSSSGPVNRSMGGAAVAAPIDSIGAIYWNPATISGLERSETALGMGVLFPNQTVASSVGGFAGSTDADAGAFPLPNIGWVHKTENPKVTLGLGINAVAGFGTNLPVDPTNPALAPTGLGRVDSNASFLQIAPVLSVALRDNLSVAAGPTLTAGRISLDPFVFGSANADGSYSSASGTRYHWGGGFQLGAYYIHSPAWRFGASLKSPTWMETFQFHSEDQLGNPRELSVDVDLPMILSLGTAYDGLENWLFALDVRYFDYKNTDGFGDRAVFDATGKLGGLDFSSVMSTSLGIQRAVSEQLTIRGGYSYNQNPVRNSEAFYNVASPLTFQHILSTGASLRFTDNLAANVAYSYFFENTRSGQIVFPGIGAIPGSTFDNTLDAHIVSFGLTIQQ
ncbi:OmpP1/FadL family transporter [Novipirellula artificiosorum]|uniref:OmpP1/FadL family transporter n=1 Tax=Novipirellula artificiosorum TaxID=2528016 RepID=UPI001E2A517C|nr:outer membrane protein transport protein [Novipirellula artificiosorum]